MKLAEMHADIAFSFFSSRQHTYGRGDKKKAYHNQKAAALKQELASFLIPTKFHTRWHLWK
jgi:hypothetical protein